MKARLVRLAFTASLLFAGCKQGDNERCQLDTDCQSGRCLLPSGATRQTGGLCLPSGTTITSTDDAAVVVTQDLSATPDLTPARDLSTGGADQASAAPDLATTTDLASTADLANAPMDASGTGG